ncbi:YdcF family protein [Sulfurirhabdus autotrophica]|uniref:Uncharacterized SAM-binding protein YcdF (DUF218 family) n=1 Tax=Sulfurirhabdus autotrophica TaxID=1706046 RepID=A0A4R3XZS4_9PROT|nr:YdcF family protein [Sulfurirhabdus autotrophica]TCV84667.1 uncharacterized SAM-binding protein YcdF (DUF218 family) [Sulfurirhabdus autotrophica]
MNWIIVNFVSAFLLPPINLLVLGIAGLATVKKHPRLGKSLIVSSFLFLFILSTPFVASTLLGSLETFPAVTSLNPNAGAIVILGAGANSSAPEYGGDTVDALSLQRVRYGATLQRRSGLPILVSGGNPTGDTPVGILMKDALERDFHVPVRWVEDQSSNTYENAIYSFKILHQSGIDTIYLVSQAWHMPRAVASFEKAGFHVIPAPTVFSSDKHVSIMDFMPNAVAFLKSYYAIHEMIGLVWYQFKN